MEKDRVLFPRKKKKKTKTDTWFEIIWAYSSRNFKSQPLDVLCVYRYGRPGFSWARLSSFSMGLRPANRVKFWDNCDVPPKAFYLFFLILFSMGLGPAKPIFFLILFSIEIITLCVYRRRRHLSIYFFFFDDRGVWASLRAPQLIPGSTEHPASPMNR